MKRYRSDIVFLIDEAVNSRYPYFQRIVTKFLKSAVDLLRHNHKSYRVALLKYSERPAIVLKLHTAMSSSFTRLKRNIERIAYSGRVSNLDHAFSLVQTKVLSQSRPDTKKIVFIISDGVNDRSRKAYLHADSLDKRMGVHINVIGIEPSPTGQRSVSYTHLTLPTIYSV